ncbi:hypothetical protein GCM10027074_14280 [Streptomyces deserti]
MAPTHLTDWLHLAGWHEPRPAAALPALPAPGRLPALPDALRTAAWAGRDNARRVYRLSESRPACG